jgi:outer membrane protein
MKHYSALLVCVLATMHGFAQTPAPPPTNPPTPPPGTTPANPALFPTTPPGAPLTPIPGAPGVLKMPTEDKANDEAFMRAASNDATEGIAVIDGPTVSLGEALRITLLQSPAIKLAQEDLEIARGTLQQSIGAFDLRVVAELEHGKTIKPLTDEDIFKAVKTREGLRETLKAVRQAKRGLERGDGQGAIAVPGDGSADSFNANDPNAAQTLALQSLIQQQATLLDNAFKSGSTGRLVKEVEKAKEKAEKNQAKLINKFEEELVKQLEEFRIDRASRATNTSWRLGLEKQFRNGLIVSPNVDWEKQGNDNFVTMNVDVTIPLGQGRGGVALRAAERAGYLDMIGAEMQLRHQISDALFRTAVSFWNLLGAQQTYQVILQSQNVTETFVNLTGKRKELGEASDSEVIKAQARYAAVELQMLQAAFGVLQARHDLAISMGLEGPDLANPPFAIGTIPTNINLSSLSARQLASIGLKSITYRDDRRAALQSLHSGKLLADAAFFEIKPVADVDLSMGWGAVTTGDNAKHYYLPFSDNKVGPSASVSFRLDWPILLNEAKGFYHRTASGYRQDQINLFDIDRQVQNDAILAVGEVLSTKAQVGASVRSSDLAFRSLSSERQRYNVGEGSLLDTLLIEEQLSTARQQEVLARVSFINAIANLRFQSGTILTPDSGHTPNQVAFSPEAFRSIPNWSAIPFPQPGPGIASLATADKPRPLLNRFFPDRSAVRDYKDSIKPGVYYQSMQDIKGRDGALVNATAPTRHEPPARQAPVTVISTVEPAPSHVIVQSEPPPTRVTTSTSRQAKVVPVESAPASTSAAPRSSGKPKGWLDRLRD